MPRGIGWKRPELEFLLQLIEERLPVGGEEWAKVAELHDKEYPENKRDKDCIKRKYSKLYLTKMPTGDPSCPWSVRRAKSINEQIKRKCDITEGNSDAESDEDDDDADEDYENAKENEDEPADGETAAAVLPNVTMDSSSSVASVRRGNHCRRGPLPTALEGLVVGRGTKRKSEEDTAMNEFFKNYSKDKLRSTRMEYDIRREELALAREQAQRQYEASLQTNQMMATMMQLMVQQQQAASNNNSGRSWDDSRNYRNWNDRNWNDRNRNDWNWNDRNWNDGNGNGNDRNWNPPGNARNDNRGDNDGNSNWEVRRWNHGDNNSSAVYSRNARQQCRDVNNMSSRRCHDTNSRSPNSATRTMDNNRATTNDNADVTNKNEPDDDNDLDDDGVVNEGEAEEDVDDCGVGGEKEETKEDEGSSDSSETIISKEIAQQTIVRKRKAVEERKSKRKSPTTLASLPATQDLLVRLKSYADEAEDDEDDKDDEDDVVQRTRRWAVVRRILGQNCLNKKLLAAHIREQTNAVSTKLISKNDVGRDKDSPSKRASKRLSEVAKRVSKTP